MARGRGGEVGNEGDILVDCCHDFGYFGVITGFCFDSYENEEHWRCYITSTI